VFTPCFRLSFRAVAFSERRTFRDSLYLSLVHVLQLVVYSRCQIFHSPRYEPTPSHGFLASCFTRGCQEEAVTIAASLGYESFWDSTTLSPRPRFINQP